MKVIAFLPKVISVFLLHTNPPERKNGGKVLNQIFLKVLAQIWMIYPMSKKFGTL